jgi:hypothetical protein
MTCRGSAAPSPLGLVSGFDATLLCSRCVRPCSTGRKQRPPAQSLGELAGRFSELLVQIHAHLPLHYHSEQVRALAGHGAITKPPKDCLLPGSDTIDQRTMRAGHRIRKMLSKRHFFWERFLALRRPNPNPPPPRGAAGAWDRTLLPLSTLSAVYFCVELAHD